MNRIISYGTTQRIQRSKQNPLFLMTVYSRFEAIRPVRQMEFGKVELGDIPARLSPVGPDHFVNLASRRREYGNVR